MHIQKLTFRDFLDLKNEDQKFLIQILKSLNIMIYEVIMTLIDT